MKKRQELRRISPTKHAGSVRVSRRSFLKGTFAAAVGASVCGAAAASVSAAEAKKSRVVLMRDPDYFGNEGLDPAVARKMVDRLVCELTGKTSVSDAWRALFSPKERIAIKVNCLYPPVTTNPETVQVVVESMAGAGFDPNRVIIFDRSDGDLQKCRFELNRSSKGAKCYATKEYVCPTKLRGVETRLSKILVDEVDALINMPVLKHHVMSGITASLKNHLGTVPNPDELHPDYCSRVAELNALDPIRKKTRLIVLDAARAQCDMGPGFNPAFFWPYSGMMASTDTIAMDTVAAKEILAKRHQMGKPGPIRPPLKHVDLAAKMGLGTGDLHQIELVEIIDACAHKATACERWHGHLAHGASRAGRPCHARVAAPDAPQKRNRVSPSVSWGMPQAGLRESPLLPLPQSLAST